MPRLDRITIYPLKSLDGVDVSEAVVLPGGALEHDRRFAIVDEDGVIINGKRTPLVHQIRLAYKPTIRVVTLGLRGVGEETSFQIDRDRDALNAWLGRHFGVGVTLREAPETGFPDDTEAPGPTVMAGSTLEAVADWFGGLDLNDCRARFRANLEIGGVEPFWDDRLYAEAGRSVRFRIGSVVFEGLNPVSGARFPAWSPSTGEPTRGFQKRFADLREETLPPWATPARFNHFYRLAVNTRRPAEETNPGLLRVGDEIEILPAPAN